MSTAYTGIGGDASVFNLKPIALSQVRPEIQSFLVPNEQIEQFFQTVRDQVIFTNKRVIVVNVQGLVGKRISYFSYPFSKVQYFGIETAGVLDIDSELVLVFNDGRHLQFDFRAKVDIKRICANISKYLL